MKKLLGILVLGLLWCNTSIGIEYNPKNFPGEVFELRGCSVGTIRENYSIDLNLGIIELTSTTTDDPTTESNKFHNYSIKLEIDQITNNIISVRRLSMSQLWKHMEQKKKDRIYLENVYVDKTLHIGVKNKGDNGYSISRAINRYEAPYHESRKVRKRIKKSFGKESGNIGNRYATCETKLIKKGNKKIAYEKEIAEKEKKDAEKKRIAEEKAKAKEYEKLEAKHRKKCKGFDKETPEYKNCIYDTENKEIAKAKTEEERIAQENKLTEIDPDLIPIATGSGFFVSRDGHIITNEHVAGICELLAIKVGGKKHYLNVITTDQVNDLGLLQGNYKNPKYLEIDIEGPNLGEEIVTMGYPLGSFTGAGVKITKGIVSSLSGPGNNYSEFQIDAAIGPGSSGGPVINKSAQVVGVAYGGINKMKAIKEQEHIPENINFAISSQTLTNFLKANKVNYTKAYRDKKLDTEVIAQIGDAATVHLYCLNTEEFYTALKKAESHTDILLDLK